MAKGINPETSAKNFGKTTMKFVGKRRNSY